MSKKVVLAFLVVSHTKSHYMDVMVGSKKGKTQMNQKQKKSISGVVSDSDYNCIEFYIVLAGGMDRYESDSGSGSAGASGACIYGILHLGIAGH